MKFSYKIQPLELRNDIISYVKSRKNVEIIFINRYDNNNLFFHSNKYYLRHLSFQIYSYICGIKNMYSQCQDKFYVFVVDANNIVKSRGITIKQKLSNIYVIESGLSVNDKILLEGIQTVKDDDKIKTEFIAAEKVIAQINK